MQKKNLNVCNMANLHGALKSVASKRAIGEPLKVLWYRVQSDEKSSEKKNRNASCGSQKHGHLHRQRGRIGGLELTNLK